MTTMFAGVAYSGGSLLLPRVSRWPIVIDLAGLELGGPIAVLADHDWSRPLGHILSLVASRTELALAGLVEGDSWDVREVLADRRPNAWQLSVGASLTDHTFVADGEVIRDNGQLHFGPLILGSRASLQEVSIVRQVADPRTGIILAGPSAAAASKPRSNDRPAPWRPTITSSATPLTLTR